MLRCLTIIVFALLLTGEVASGCGFKRLDPPLRGSPFRPSRNGFLPDSVDWRNVNGTNYAQGIRNQHSPLHCGGCWSFAPSRAITDHFRIHDLQGWGDRWIAPQAAINCCSGSCASGGDATEVLEYAKKYGLPDETCQPFQGKDLQGGCSDINQCKNCFPPEKEDCSAVPAGDFPRFFVDSWGGISGEKDMMTALVDGPIVCNMADNIEFQTWDGSGGVYEDKTGRKIISHVVSIVGYGSLNGTPYWVVANSWGTFWADKGYALLIRGIDNLAIEEECFWLKVKV